MNGKFTKKDLAEVIKLARLKKGLSWTQIADYIGKHRVWTVAALLGEHPLSASDASTVATLLDLGDEAIPILKMLPYRGSDKPIRDDPTIYRFHEALTVYGSAIKELIHEEFGDGIMSAVNFRVTIERRPHPGGDRVVVIFDGKFLDYAWEHTGQANPT